MTKKLTKPFSSPLGDSKWFVMDSWCASKAKQKDPNPLGDSKWFVMDS
jgi:hypothetical protein